MLTSSLPLSWNPKVPRVWNRGKRYVKKRSLNYLTKYALRNTMLSKLTNCPKQSLKICLEKSTEVIDKWTPMHTQIVKQIDLKKHHFGKDLKTMVMCGNVDIM